MATQNEIAKHLSLSLKGARNMLSKLDLNNKSMSLDEIRIAYIQNLDKISGERVGHLDISNERLKLMDAQRRKTRIETKILRMRAQESNAPAAFGKDDQEDLTLSSKYIEQTNAQMLQLVELLRKPSANCNTPKCPNHPEYRRH